MFIAVVLLT